MRIKILSPELANKVGRELNLEIKDEIAVEELKREIVQRFPEAKEEFSDEHFYIFSVNGRILSQDELKDFKLKNDDFIIIFPAIAGG